MPTVYLIGNKRCVLDMLLTTTITSSGQKPAPASAINGKKDANKFPCPRPFRD
jgi:hypothetical protein